jgi:hypothetical protein
LNEPQFAALQLAIQSTPRSCVSLTTETASVVCEPACIVAGGTCMKDAVTSLAPGGRTDFVMHEERATIFKSITRDKAANRPERTRFNGFDEVAKSLGSIAPPTRVRLR